MRKDITLILVGISLVGLVVGYLAAATYLPQWFTRSQGLVGETSADLMEEELVDEQPMTVTGEMRVEFAQKAAQVGEEVEAEIVIDTRGKTISGFDAIAELDPQSWSVLVSEVRVNQTGAFVSYPRNEIVSQEGKVYLSGLTDLNKGFSGEMVVGSFLLRPQKPGTLKVEIAYKGQGAGDDANLAETGTGEDILNKIGAGILEVK